MKPWIKSISPDDMALDAIVEKFGGDGYMKFVQVLDFCLDCDITDITVEIIKKQTNSNIRGAKTLLPFFREAFAKVYPRFCKTLPKVSPKFTQSLPKLEASNPLYDRPLSEENKSIERREYNTPPPPRGENPTSTEVVEFKKPTNFKNKYEYTEAFEEWWHAYPNRQDKPKTFKLYQKALLQTSQEKLLEAARAYSAQVNAERRELRHVKHSTSWLNAGGWDSDFTPSRPPGPRKLQTIKAIPGQEITSRLIFG